MKYKGRILRPERIGEGVKNALKSKISGGTSNEVLSRREKCDAPCKFKEKGRCTLCGCVTKLKQESPYDHCPKNFWDDIKIVEDFGLAIKNHSTDKAVLRHFGGNTVRVELLKDVPHEQPISLSFSLVNERSNFFDKEHSVKGIVLKTTCSCTAIATDLPQSLGDGKHFEFSVTYDAKRIGVFEKTVKIQSDNLDTLFLVVKGRVTKNSENE